MTKYTGELFAFLKGLINRLGAQPVLNAMRELDGGIPEEVLKKQFDAVVNIHSDIFLLSPTQILKSRRQFEGRRVICLASIHEVLVNQYYWKSQQVADYTGKHQPNLRQGVLDLRALYPPHPASEYLISMHEKSVALCAESEII